MNLNQKYFLSSFSMVFCLALFYFSLAFAEEFRYDSKGKRDPFISSEQSAAELGSGQLRVEGIILDPRGKSYAIVNGEIVGAGDVFAGFKVKQIEANQVLFEGKDGQLSKVILNPDELKIQKYLKGLEKKESLIEASKETSKPAASQKTPVSNLKNLAEVTRQKLLEEVPKPKEDASKTIPTVSEKRSGT